MVVAAGLLAPLVLLPALAFALIWWFAPNPAVEAGLLLVASCPIGGISNTYSYLARASTALSVTLTGLSCVLAVVTIPLLTGAFQRFQHDALRVDAPVTTLLTQLVFMLALPLAVGMIVRRRWPAWARARRPVIPAAGVRPARPAPAARPFRGGEARVGDARGRRAPGGGLRDSVVRRRVVDRFGRAGRCRRSVHTCVGIRDAERDHRGRHRGHAARHGWSSPSSPASTSSRSCRSCSPPWRYAGGGCARVWE